MDELSALLAAAGVDGTAQDYERAVLEDNVLSKRSDNTHRNTLRYLRELYLLDEASPIFRALSRLWSVDLAAQPLPALVCALDRHHEDIDVRLERGLGCGSLSLAPPNIVTPARA